VRDFRHHPAVSGFFTLGIADTDYVVAGSGPLFVRGLIDSVSDLDIVARGQAWTRATELAEAGPAPFGGALHVLLFDARLEILDRWFPELWSVDYLIDTADVFHGVRFVSLDIVRTVKQILNRSKDSPHLAIIEEYLAEGGH
jgi:hypothetical protein